MKIFPAIDIKDKKCVRLIKGDFNNKTEYEISPVDQAGKYKDHGFKNLHIVDLDGALTGETVNLDIIIPDGRLESNQIIHAVRRVHNQPKVVCLLDAARCTDVGFTRCPRKAKEYAIHPLAVELACA